MQVESRSFHVEQAAIVANALEPEFVESYSDSDSDDEDDLINTRQARNASTNQNVVIEDVDIGQPCLSCENKCPGFVRHSWRSVCGSCRCARDLHDLYLADFVDVRARLGWQPPDDPRMRTDREGTLAAGYTWMPAGLEPHQVEEFMGRLDPSRVPLVATPGEKYRELQLIRQLPAQDMSADHCRHLKDDEERKQYAEFQRRRDSHAMAIARVQPCPPNDLDTHKNRECRGCGAPLEADELTVVSPLTPSDGAEPYYHPVCFVCATCDEMLTDLTHCYHSDGTLLCQRHYAEREKPRCAACDELIFSGEYTRAMEQDFHSGHFSCWNCDMSLTGHRYILRDEHPYCIKCYENLFANTCEECKSVIGTDSKDLSYKDKHWHENCFKCVDCQVSLVDQPFASKNDKLYCAGCHDNNFAARCDGCGNIFSAGMKKFEYKGKQWHEQCFCCKVCQQPVGSKSFIPRDAEVVCVPCYEDQYAQRCAKCSGVINKGGITYKSTPFHRDCFACTNCSKLLAGEKFTSRDEQPYCADCFGELFAKKCCRCTKPITGLGGTKFISFEERHWHSDCFVCYRCDMSLVGRGFLTDGADILCPECGKN